MQQTTTFRQLWQRLAPLCGEGEAKAVVGLVLEQRFHLSRADVACGAVEQLPPAALADLEAIVRRLLQGEPVQYVLGQAEFCGRIFHVGPGVLIPRPETAGLCQWVAQQAPPHPAILDIGTGSGCIACTLAATLPQAQVAACDISAHALRTASSNADSLGVHVDFWQCDALAPPDHADRWHIVVSNPPYVCQSEAADMERHVLDHEPALALFVPDDDPLRFYRAIGRYARKALHSGGLLFFELNTRFAPQTADLLAAMGFAAIELRDDLFGRTRFIKAQQP